MENKQTAVDWFFAYMGQKQYMGNDILEAYKKAKELEKQQIMDAFGVGCHHESKRLVGYQDIAEQYYNETFNK